MTDVQEQMEYELRESIRLHDLRNHAVNDLVKSAYKRYYRKQIVEGGSLPKVLQMAVAHIGIESFAGETRGRKKDTTRWFVTVSAKDNIDVFQFFNQMQKCVKKQKLQGSGKYVIEQRSESDQDPYGWHLHWLVQFDTQSSKSVIIQQVAQCFQKYISGTNYVDCRPIYSDEDWTAKQKYIEGGKKEDKMSKVEKDRLLRKKYKLPEIISY